MKGIIAAVMLFSFSSFADVAGKNARDVWAEFMDINPSNGDLSYILLNGLTEYKVRAAEELIKRDDEFYFPTVLRFAPASELAVFAKAILEKCSRPSCLVDIIESAPEPWKAEAWKKLLSQSPGNQDLILVLLISNSKYRSLAAVELLRKNPSREELEKIARLAPAPWNLQAAEMRRLHMTRKEKLMRLMQGKEP